MWHKKLFIAVISCLLLVVAFGAPGLSRAQNAEPTALIDSIFRDLSQRLGRTLTRTTVDNWVWQDNLYPDSSLGCPQPGQTYTPGNVRGYQITISVNSVTYDYRAPKNGSGTFFLCSPVSPSAPPTTIPPTSVPPTPIPVIQPSQPAALPANPTPTSSGTGTGVTYQNGLAYISLDGNVHIRSLDGSSDTALTADGGMQWTFASLTADPSFKTVRNYAQLRWPPDGTKLLFTELSTRTIYTVASGISPVPIVSDYGLDRDLSYPAAWSADGAQIVYGALAANGAPSTARLFTVPADGSRPPMAAAGLARDCSTGGGGNVFKLDQNAYRYELGKTVFDYPAFLAWPAHNFLYNGGPCLDLVDTNSAGIVWTAHNLTNVVVSPDGTHALALSQALPPGVELVDLASGNLTAIAGLPANVDQIAWSPDGQNILYSTSTPGVTILGDPNSLLGKQLFGTTWPVTGSANHVGLWRVPLTGGTATQVFDELGYRIAAIAPAPGNTGAVVTLITSMADLIQAINSGQTPAQIDPAVPHPELYFVPFNTAGAAPARIGRGGQPAFSSGTFVAIPTGGASGITATPVAQCPGAPPSRLMVGGTGHVTPGDPNDLRATPGGASIGKIPGGAAFLVLQGPICTPNGITWWQVNYNGQIGWTAESQGSTYFLEP